MLGVQVLNIFLRMGNAPIQQMDILTMLGFVILIVAALSYLGLGTAPPTPDWGADLRAAQDHMETRPLTAVFPGLAIFYTVLGFNLVGDGLRDAADPYK